MPRKTSPTNQPDEQDEVSYDIIDSKSWDISQMMCGKAKLNKSKQGKSVPLTSGNRRFYLKTPKMYCPFGVGKPPLKEGEAEKKNPQWSIQMTFNKDDADCQLFQQKAVEFDDFMVSQGAIPENSVDWLGASRTKPFSREVVEHQYKTMVKFSKDKVTREPSTQYPPYIRANLPTTFQEPYALTCEIYNKSNELVTASPDPNAPNCITKVIQSGCYVSALLSGSIWCNDATGFGVTWRVAQLKFFPPKGSIPKGKCMIGDPEDEDEEETTTKAKDSDETVEDPEPEIIEEVEVVTPAPAPAPAKARAPAKK